MKGLFNGSAKRSSDRMGAIAVLAIVAGWL